MTSDPAELQARVKVLEAELSRTRNQLRKAYRDRADLHARYRALLSSETPVFDTRASTYALQSVQPPSPQRSPRAG